MGEWAYHKIIVDISLNCWEYMPSLLYPDNQTTFDIIEGT
jgi:hypothetical protein